MAKHTYRRLRTFVERLGAMADDLKAIFGELEAQGTPELAVTGATPETLEATCPWETGDFCTDFLEFYRLEIAKPTGLPRPMSLNTTRKAKILARKTDKLLVRENWPILAERIKGNAALRGETGWPGAAFDWVLNPTNLTKILEGNYKSDGQQNTGGGSGLRPYSRENPAT